MTFNPETHVIAPRIPTEAMWGGLARDIVTWQRMYSPGATGRQLHDHLTALGRKIPDWLKEEIPIDSLTCPKGTVAAVIYRAMIEDICEGEN